MPASAIPINPTGGAPSQSSQSKSLPDALKELLALRLEADALDSEALQDELQQGSTGPLASTMSAKLEEIAKLGATWKSRLPAAVARKVTPEEEARGLFIQAWALGRVGQYTTPDSKKLAAQLEDALALFQRAADLLELPPPPTLAEVPSVTRPAPVGKHPALLLPEQSAWVGDLLAEWARAQTTLAFALLLNDDEGVDEGKLSDILELSCRRNVQGTFKHFSRPCLERDTLLSPVIQNFSFRPITNLLLTSFLFLLSSFHSLGSLFPRRRRHPLRRNGDGKRPTHQGHVPRLPLRIHHRPKLAPSYRMGPSPRPFLPPASPR